MTISYNGNFCRLLLRWKGSIWRLVWKELLIFLVLYYAIRLCYTFALPLIDDDEQHYRHKFEQLAILFNDYTKMIPLTFLLGFYVTNVVVRWWRQFECLPWPEDMLSTLCMVIPGQDETSQRRRHAIARWANLSAALVYREISSKLRRRFPTMRELVASGLLTENELVVLDALSVDSKSIRWMTPLHWIQQVITDEMHERSPMASLVNHFIQDLKLYRASFRRLFCHDWVSVPLVYTQVAALATYAYFGFCLLGRQFLVSNKDKKQHDIDLIVPLFTIVQFLFFVGWFKVGQDLMRPFGMDDDDIELDYIFERNVLTSFAIVNRLQMRDHAPLEEDAFWTKDSQKIQTIPHTGLSYQTKQHRPVRHIASYKPMIDEEKLDIGRTGCTAIKNRWKEHEEIMW